MEMHEKIQLDACKSKKSQKKSKEEHSKIAQKFLPQEKKLNYYRTL